MIKLKKGPKPKILIDNAERWTEEYCECLDNNEKPSSTVANRYNCPEIKDALEDETHGKCAYCGKEKPLLPEHLIPQTILSKEHPELVDRIQNIVPSCSDCNHSKLRHDWEEWYKAQDFYTDARCSAIKRHINKYKL